jgi:hypothetical protein
MIDRHHMTMRQHELEREARDRARRLEARRRGAAQARREAQRAATMDRLVRERRQGSPSR